MSGSTLTEREPEILRLAAQGSSDYKIATRPTQTERAYYTIVGTNVSIEPQDVKSAEDLAKSIRESYEELNKYTHERGSHAGVAPEEIENQLISVFNQTQIYILEILRMRQKFFKEQFELSRPKPNSHLVKPDFHDVLESGQRMLSYPL